MPQIDNKTRIIASSDSLDFDKDRRYFIPFLSGSLIGFINRENEIVLPTKYEITHAVL